MITAELLRAIELAAEEVAASAPAPSSDLLREHLDVLAPLASAAATGRGANDETP